MTGRKGRVVCTDDGISYESRSESDVPLEILNLTEKQRFMDGEKVGTNFIADFLQTLCWMLVAIAVSRYKYWGKILTLVMLNKLRCHTNF